MSRAIVGALVLAGCWGDGLPPERQRTCIESHAEKMELFNEYLCDYWDRCFDEWSTASRPPPARGKECRETVQYVRYPNYPLSECGEWRCFEALAVGECIPERKECFFEGDDGPRMIRPIWLPWECAHFMQNMPEEDCVDP